MYHVGLFEGIGGFSLAARWAGLNSEISCEIDEDCRDVLKSNFPNTTLFEDVKKLTKETFDEILISKYGENYGEQMLLTGGFPCQPFSYSGNRGGASDNRYLWPEMLRIIKSVRPSWVIGENVAGLITMVLPPEASAMGNSSYYREGVLFNIIESLVKAEYDVQTFIIPACAVGAPHLRERLWIVARRNDLGDKQKFSFRDADGGSGIGNLSDQIALLYNPDGKVSLISHLFIEDMMGFPTNYCKVLLVKMFKRRLEKINLKKSKSKR